MNLPLPKTYQDFIATLLPNEATQWLKSASRILDSAVSEFQLTELSLVDNLTYNIVCYATSNIYGPVVLKICLPNFEAIQEMQALQLYDGHFACRCYYQNTTDRLLILERILPGTTLNKVPNRHKRIAIFADLATNLLLPINKAVTLPAYYEVYQRALSKVEWTKPAYAAMKENILLAGSYYQLIQQSSSALYLLHGDLHHDNILLAADGYRAIDPQGFIGEKVLETARFCENELAKQTIDQANIRQIIDLLAKHFKEEPSAIALAWFVDFVLSTLWDIEDNCPETLVKQNLAVLQLLNKYLTNN